MAQFVVLVSCLFRLVLFLFIDRKVLWRVLSLVVLEDVQGRLLNIAARQSLLLLGANAGFW